jgi:hypothetical protein
MMYEEIPLAEDEDEGFELALMELVERSKAAILQTLFVSTMIGFTANGEAKKGDELIGMIEKRFRPVNQALMLLLECSGMTHDEVLDDQGARYEALAKRKMEEQRCGN